MNGYLYRSQPSELIWRCYHQQSQFLTLHQSQLVLFPNCILRWPSKYMQSLELSSFGEFEPEGFVRTSREMGHCEATESCNLGVSAVGANQESHHFVERSDVELSHRFGVLQPILNKLAGIEQLKSNVVVVSPSLQKHEHA